MSVKAEAFSAVRWTTLVTVGRVVLQTVQLIVLARLISPQDFGTMAMILSVTAFIQLFADLGISTTIIYSTSISKEVLSTLYWLNVIMGAILSALVGIGSPWIADFYRNANLGTPLALTGTSFLFLALGQQIKVLAEKRMAFKSVAIVEGTSAVISTGVTIAMAVSGAGVYSLVVGMLALALGNTILYWIFARDGWRPQFCFRLREASEHLRAGLYLLGTSLANTATLQADVIIVGRLLGGAVLGSYTVPRELCLKIMFATNPIVNRVGTPLIAKAQHDRELLRKVYLATIRMTSSINFPIYGGIAVFRHEIVEIVFGPNWTSSADLLGVMAVWGMFRALGNPSGILFSGTGRAKMAFVQSLAVTATIIPTIWLGSIWGTFGVAVALGGYYLIFAFVIWYYAVGPITGAGLTEYTRQWAVPFLITLGTAAIVTVPASEFESTFAKLALGIPLSAFAYLTLSALFNRQWLSSMLGMMGLGTNLASLRKRLQTKLG